ncbi:MAG: phenylalanine--tRNA ligase subunit alpha [Rhodospirillaceae bacterium]|nr:phenylalanine--tRNA ligase subunit alpha [Rhodospirillaceae bacterium]MBT5912386.1 phenylalanine--tRNA ligase subunit alpha [Rhodospirillaceae bacterium]MDC1441090.1 phenylalanine--tRNA ligase subunit alpha [Rhodospirillaceae bacterium]
MQDWEDLKAKLVASIHSASKLSELEDIRITALGKKGSITGLMKRLGALDPDKRREAGQLLNRIKVEVASNIDERKVEMEDVALEEQLLKDRVDVTLPARPENTGSIHPITQTIDELTTIFCEMGFTVADGPHIETDYYNFSALNIPPEHPARQEQDTFYLPSDETGTPRVLRTHTSPVQIRTMEKATPPIKIIVPGRTFRSDHDATHSPMFHQVEGLVIDKTSHMGHLKGCLIDFCRAFFGVDDLPVRFRPSYFPFTEPSAEVDIGCTRAGGEFRIGKGDDWLEILGSGMVHPRVLEGCGINPDEYQGFAFGMGIERIAMLKYGIPDLRPFYDTDIRWLKHYGFVPLDLPTIAGGINR